MCEHSQVDAVVLCRPRCTRPPHLTPLPVVVHADTRRERSNRPPVPRERVHTLRGMSTSGPRKSLFSSLASTADHEQLPAALVEWVAAQPTTEGAPLPISGGADGLEELKDGVRLAQVVAQM